MIYKRFEREERYFHTCLLDELHRRTQTFIHSGADGLVTALDFDQLQFHEITKAIDNYSYQVKRPIQPTYKRKQDQTPVVSNYNPSKKPRTRGYPNGSLVHNPNIHPDMKIPSPGTYHNVFNPKYTGTRKFTHQDGTTKCNNWHHRGFCRSDCQRIASHSKTLTPDEIVAGKTLVLKAFGKWSADQNSQRPAIPPGHPPSNSPSSASEPNSPGK